MPVTNEQLVQNLIYQGVLKNPDIIDAFFEIDRLDFVPPEYQDLAYLDDPLPIGKGQTISQPFTVAFMLELLRPRESQQVLDLGSGSGWTAALLAQIVGPSGKVYGVEIIPELVSMANKNLKKYLLPQVIVEQAGPELGFPGLKFDRILVSATSPTFPDQLLKQLKLGGRMVLPVGTSIFEVEKTLDGQVNSKEYPGFMFVPLV